MRLIFICAAILLCSISFSQNVGIGTTTPVSKLTIQTPLSTTGFTHVGGANEIVVSEAIGSVSASLGTTTNHAFRLMTNNTGKISIYPAGEVVIGPNASGANGKFTVISDPGNVGITNTDNNIILSTFLGGTQPFAYIGTQSNHALSFYTNNSQSRMILTPEGNVGIGTINPGARLHVAGIARVDSYTDLLGPVGIGTIGQLGTGLHILNNAEAIRLTGSNPYISFFNGSTYKGYLWRKGNDDIELGTAGANPNGRLLFSIKGTTYLEMLSNGKIAINGQSANFANPAVTINGTLVLKDLANNFNEWALRSESEELVFYFNGWTKGWIGVDGEYNVASDARLKDNIHAYREVLPGLLKLNVLNYHYKSSPAGTSSMGLIAQNVATYFPDIVSQTHMNGKKFFGVSYAKTGVLAIKAIQEQQVIIDQQQATIDQQQSTILSLEKRLAAIEKLLNTR
jgi:hypothetical protein